MKKTAKMKRFMVLLAAVALCICMVGAIPVQAASTKTVYVVTSVKVKEGSKTTNITLTYNDNGLLKKIASTFSDEKVSETFSYNTKNQLKKYVNKVLSGEHKGAGDTTTYAYNSKGQRKSKTESEGGTCTYKYNTKGQIKSETGEHVTTKFTYHTNGHVKKTASDDGNITYSASFDDKGNITKWTRKWQTEKIGYGKYTFTYNSAGRAKTLKKTFKPNPMGNEKTQTLTFTYTKMKVPAALTDSIADQQWQFINGDGIVAFAW